MVSTSLPTAKITNPDVTRLINSSEIQSVVRQAGSKVQKRPWTQHKNPLKNKGVLFRLNPYAKTIRRQELRKSRSCCVCFGGGADGRVQLGRSARSRRAPRSPRARRRLAMRSSRLSLLLENAYRDQGDWLLCSCCQSCPPVCILRAYTSIHMLWLCVDLYGVWERSLPTVCIYGAQRVENHV